MNSSELQFFVFKKLSSFSSKSPWYFWYSSVYLRQERFEEAKRGRRAR